MPKRLLALLFVLLLLIPSFAALKGLDSPLSKAESTVKIGESVIVPPGADVTSAVAIGGSVTVGGKVKEDVVAIGGDVVLLPTAVVGGNVAAVGGKIEKASGAVVKGETTEVKFPAGMLIKGLGWGVAVLSLLSFISFLILAAILIALFGKPLGVTSYYIERLPGHALLWGFLGTILIVPLIILMLISIIGIPFIPIFLIVLAAACIFGYIAAAQLIGKIFLKWIRVYNKPMMFEALAGLVVLFVISLLPIFGWIVKSIFGLMGLGAVIVTWFGARQA